MDSPWAWCPKCRALIPVTPSLPVMQTVFHLEPFGIFPYGWCERHRPAGLSAVPAAWDAPCGHVPVPSI